MRAARFTEPRSFGWRTDLIFARFDGEVASRGDHLVVRTAHNPSFWWGHFLLFDHAPSSGDAAAWLARFEAEVARAQPESRHLAFGVDREAAFELPADFAAAGLTLFALVIVADAHDVAIGLYESLGFPRGACTWHLYTAAPRAAPSAAAP